jgi:hypothetical protein
VGYAQLTNPVPVFVFQGDLFARWRTAGGPFFEVRELTDDPAL